MGGSWSENLQASAEHVRESVWPLVADWYPEAQLNPVEGWGEVPATRALDAGAGVDYLLAYPTHVEGLSSRVQLGGEVFDSLTLGIAELNRLRTARDREGAIRPTESWQAYVDASGLVTYVIGVRTDDLVDFVANFPELVERRTNTISGKAFFVVWADELAAHGIAVKRTGNGSAMVSGREGPFRLMASPYESMTDDRWCQACGRWSTTDSRASARRVVALSAAVATRAKSPAPIADVTRRADALLTWLATGIYEPMGAEVDARLAECLPLILSFMTNGAWSLGRASLPDLVFTLKVGLQTCGIVPRSWPSDCPLCGIFGGCHEYA